MSGGRRDDDRAGRAMLLLWRPLPGEDDASDPDGAAQGEPVPDWCTRCGLPLGSRYYERPTIGHDRAGCGPPGPGGRAHTWCIRQVWLCSACYTADLEREVGAGWTRTGERAGGPSGHARRGDWDD